MEEGLGCDSMSDKVERDEIDGKNADFVEEGKGIESNGEEKEVILNEGETLLTMSPERRIDIELNKSEVERAESVKIDSKYKAIRKIIGGLRNERDGISLKKVKEEIPCDDGLNGIEMKKAKEENLDGEIEIIGRVLRSRSSLIKSSKLVESGTDKEVDKGRTSSIVECKSKTIGDCLKNKRVEVEIDEIDSSVDGRVNTSTCKPRKPPKLQKTKGMFKGKMGKRGRPPKDLVLKFMLDKEKKLERPPNVQDNSVVLNVRPDKEKKLERPPKLKNKRVVLNVRPDKGKKKRGRPKNGESKVMLDKEEKPSTSVKTVKASKFYRAVKNGPYDIIDEKIITATALDSQRISSAIKDESGCSGAEENGSIHEKKGQVVKKIKHMKEGGRATEKQLLREQLKTLILDAGWTIDYRPRKGKEYNDAVYISPKGRGYWSVTLAYRVLKKQFEKNAADVIKHAKPGFSFMPVSEEVVNMLARISKKKKERERKLKRQGDCGSDLDREVNCKKSKKERSTKNAGSADHTTKQYSVMKSGGKLSRGTSKGKLLQHDIRNKSRRALLVRGSEKDQNSNSDGLTQYHWKRTVLNWMIDLETIPLNGKVHYMKQRKTRTKFEGTITRGGISCSCCNGIVTISEFEAHSKSKSGQPFQNIYLEDGDSLLKCQLHSWNKQEESVRKGFHYIDTDGNDPNDDSCGICGNGGNLICCDGCPSTFHQSCLNIREFPSGNWHCIYCSCKFCGIPDGNTSLGDDNHEISGSILLTCHLCEQRYHQSCIQAKDGTSDNCIDLSFCGKKCQEVFEKLRLLLGVRHNLEEGYSWTFLQRSDISPDVSLSGIYEKVECNSKLAVALAIMDECFLPIIDHRTSINLIHNVVYNCGSNFNRLNYSGFFTAILEKGDEIICAASIRIRGDDLAEMPFIGTRYVHRRQGMCSRLLSAIETALRSLNVTKLVIPAVSELMQTWTEVFGFEPLEESQRQEMKNMNLLVFPCTDMLQKPLLEHQRSQENIKAIADTESTELGKEQVMLEVVSETKVRSAGSDISISYEDISPHAAQTNGIPLDSGSQLPGACSNTSDITSETVNFQESAGDENYPVQSGSIHNKFEGRNKIDDSSHEQNLQHFVQDVNRKQIGSVVPKLDKNNMEESSQPIISETKSISIDGLSCVGNAADVPQSISIDEDGTKSGIVDSTHDSEAIYFVPYDTKDNKNPDEKNMEESNQRMISGTESILISGLNSLGQAADVVVPQSKTDEDELKSHVVNITHDSEAVCLMSDEAKVNKNLDNHATATPCSAVSPCNLNSSPSVALLGLPGGLKACNASEVIVLSNKAG